MTCPQCGLDDGHYLRCSRLDNAPPDRRWPAAVVLSAIVLLGVAVAPIDKAKPTPTTLGVETGRIAGGFPHTVVIDRETALSAVQETHQDRFSEADRLVPVPEARPSTTLRLEDQGPPITAPELTTTTTAAAPQTTEAAAVLEGPWTTEEWRPLVEVYFAPGDVDRALCLMAFESGGKPTAQNPSGASGLLQVMPFWAESLGLHPDQLFDPATNLEVAAHVLAEQGWRAWDPYKRGECR